jgi:anti-sigma B factor antagonist
MRQTQANRSGEGATPTAAVLSAAGDGIAFKEERRDTCRVLRVYGLLDSRTSALLEKRLGETMAAPCRGVVVCLEQATFVDSSGIGALVAALHKADQNGTWIRLVGTPPAIRAIMRSSALDTVLVTFSSVTKAVRFRMASPSAPLRAEYRDADGYLRLTLEGGFDISTAAPVERRLAEAVESGRHRILVDLEDVTLIDAHALGVLVSTLRRVNQRGGWVRVVCTDDQILKVLHITGLDHVLGIFGSVEEAAGAATRKNGIAISRTRGPAPS